jgi:uncharacterized protein involved in response to NO
MLAGLVALSTANVFVHLDALHEMPVGTGRRACLAAVDVVVLVSLIIAGRVVPMFTRNATGVATIRSSPPLDALAAGSMAALTIVDVVMPEGAFAGVAAALVAVLVLARMRTWGTRHTLAHPLLWILHAGHAWIAAGLALRAVAELTHAISGSLATHALTAGAIGSLTIGMMARVSLGHSGRALAVRGPVVVAFAAITLAAIARAVVPLLLPTLYLVTLYAAAALWTLAFVLFLFVYVPILTSPRADGKAG